MNIPITDGLETSFDLSIRDDSPIAKANPSRLVSSSKNLLTEFSRPIDQVDFDSAGLGFTFQSPSALIGDAAKLSIKSGSNSVLKILKPSDKTVFPKDEFSSPVPIAATECWIGLELTSAVEVKAAASLDGFGVALADKSELTAGYYQAVPERGQLFPTLRQALPEALERFQIVARAQDLLNQPAGTVIFYDTNGSVKLTGSYSVPLSVQPLASAELPFHYRLEAGPAAQIRVAGELAVFGEFRTRCYRKSATELELSLYKRHGTSLTAAFTEVSGLKFDDSTTTLLDAFLDSVLPGVKSEAAQVPASDQKAFAEVLKDSVDRSLTIALNMACTATNTDETAVCFLIDLDQHKTETIAAIRTALKGDWTSLTKLANAKSLRNVIVHSEESKHRVRINLFGFLNAENATDYLKSCTMLRDETGQLTLIDRTKASRISVASSPYAAEAERLRRALAESFLSTITYAVTSSGSATGKLGANLNVQQTYFRYDNHMDRFEWKRLLSLARELGLLSEEQATNYLSTADDRGPVQVTASASYDTRAAESLFFSNVTTRTLRSAEELERTGRRMLAALIDPDEPVGRTRLQMLNDDQLWSRLNTLGNVSSFTTIPELSRLPAPELGAISADWTAVRWWTDSMLSLGKKLSQMLQVIDRVKASDPLSNPDFVRKRDSLLNELRRVTKNTHAVFAEGWGLAVMHNLAGKLSPVSMEITRPGITQRYESQANEESPVVTVADAQTTSNRKKVNAIS